MDDVDEDTEDVELQVESDDDTDDAGWRKDPRDSGSDGDASGSDGDDVTLAVGGAGGYQPPEAPDVSTWSTTPSTSWTP